MKKAAALVLALLLAFVFGACGSEESADEFRVDVFWYKFDDQYLTGVHNSMTGYLDAADIKYEYHDCEEDQDKQLGLIDAAISRGTSLLVVNQVNTGDTDVSMSIVEKAKAQGLPLVFFNREVSDDVIVSYDKCVFVGSKYLEAGYRQGELAFEILSADFDKYDLNGDGKFQYIMLKGALGSPEPEPISEVSIEECNRLLTQAGFSELEYYDPANTDLFQSCDWNTEKAQDTMAAALGTNPMDGNNPIEVVFSNNDTMALGAVNALNEVGWNTGGGDAIPVFAIDAEDMAVEMIAEGKMAGTIKQDGDGMAKCIVEFTKATKEKKDWADVLADYPVDSGVRKIRIPYIKIS